MANLWLLLASCLVGLSLCEVSLRLLYPKYRGLANAQVNQDAMRIWSNMPNARSWKYHPDTGSAHPFQHNNLGLRQHRNFTEADLTPATNIGVFGDSFVENIGLSAPYSFTEPLDYLLNQSGIRFNVLNFGVHAYGPGQSFLHYEHFRYINKLDYFLYVYCENDTRNIHETRLFHLDEAGRLDRPTTILSPWWVRLISRLHISYLILDASECLFQRSQNLLSKELFDEYQRRTGVQGHWHEEHIRHSLYRGKMDDGEFKSSLAIFQRIVRRWKQLVENNGGAFSIVLLPVTPVHPDVAAVLMEEDVKVFDLYDCFSSYDPAHTDRPWRDSPYRFKNDGHWNEAGNRLAAVCLYRLLEEEMGVPALSEKRFGESLRKYYSAFVEGWIPRIPGGGADVALPRPLVFERNIRRFLMRMSFSKRRLRKVAAAPDEWIIRSTSDVSLLRILMEGERTSTRYSPQEAREEGCVI